MGFVFITSYSIQYLQGKVAIWVPTSAKSSSWRFLLPLRGKSPKCPCGDIRSSNGSPRIWISAALCQSHQGRSDCKFQKVHLLWEEFPECWRVSWATVLPEPGSPCQVWIFFWSKCSPSIWLKICSGKGCQETQRGYKLFFVFFSGISFKNRKLKEKELSTWQGWGWEPWLSFLSSLATFICYKWHEVVHKHEYYPLCSLLII